MRRGQSSVEPMLVFSAVVLVAVAACYWRIDDLVVVVQRVAAGLESSEHFERLRAIVEGR